MSQQKEAQSVRDASSDINEIVQIIAKIAKFRGIKFEADERKVKLYRSGSSQNPDVSTDETEDRGGLKYG